MIVGSKKALFSKKTLIQGEKLNIIKKIKNPSKEFIIINKK